VAESEWVGVVDDDASIRCSLERVFRSNGIRVETFRSAEDYLERTVAGEPQCIVLDVHMGELSGFDLQDLLTAAGRAPPIIFITAHGNIPADRLARCGDAPAYLRKPFDTNRLVELVRRHLQPDSRTGSGQS
jgi:two-component system, LuxR family, response regulator FixJ